jgi:hypothetical protein
MLSAAILQLSTMHSLPPDAWAQLLSSETRVRSTTTVDFIIPDRAARERGEHTVRIIRKQEGAVEVRRATSTTCPAVSDAVSSFRTVPMPQPQFPDQGTKDVRDGRTYIVRFDARYGDDDAGVVELSSNMGTPLADWVDKLLAKLGSC